MKVIVRKRYYKEDTYSVPRHGGGFTKEKMNDFTDDIRKLSKIEQIKGSFHDYEIRVGEYCCKDIEEHGEARAEKYYHGFDEDNWGLGIFLPFQGWEDADYIRIDYCPFCGEKIEVVEEK